MNDTIPFSATVNDAVKLSGIGRTELYRFWGRVPSRRRSLAGGR